MLQLFFAVAFSAVPLTLYVPPIRSLSLFVETLEDLLHHTAIHTIRAYPRFRLAFSRLFASVFRVSYSRNLGSWILDILSSLLYMEVIFLFGIISDDGFSFRFVSFFFDSVSDLLKALDCLDSLFLFFIFLVIRTSRCNFLCRFMKPIQFCSNPFP
ncbi:hypothetical protein Csa_012384 [Cucumis sativus]|nr:hypothetical protein Csa_012384 [Cucumis sativus]